MPHTNEDTEKEIENEEVQTEDLQPNLQTGSITVQKNGHFIHCLTVIGQIEGHQVLPETVKTTMYEHVIPLLAAVEESAEVDGLLVLINTVGGDVEAGLAIAELQKYEFYGKDKTEVYWVHFTGSEVKNILRKNGFTDKE